MRGPHFTPCSQRRRACFLAISGRRRLHTFYPGAALPTLFLSSSGIDRFLSFYPRPGTAAHPFYPGAASPTVFLSRVEDTFSTGSFVKIDIGLRGMLKMEKRKVFFANLDSIQRKDLHKLSIDKKTILSFLLRTHKCKTRHLCISAYWNVGKGRKYLVRCLAQKFIYKEEKKIY